MPEQPSRVIPLREIVRRVADAPPELRRLGDNVLMERCLVCQAQICLPRSASCMARRRTPHMAANEPPTRNDRSEQEIGRTMKLILSIAAEGRNPLEGCADSREHGARKTSLRAAWRRGYMRLNHITESGLRALAAAQRGDR